MSLNHDKAKITALNYMSFYDLAEHKEDQTEIDEYLAKTFRLRRLPVTGRNFQLPSRITIHGISQ